MSARRYTVEDWRRAVYQHPGISDSTRVLLLLLSEYMRSDLTVSVPRPTLLKRLGQQDNAASFNRRLNDRFREAVGEKPEDDPMKGKWNLEHRLLDRKVRGQKHVTAVYAALIPNLQGDARQPAEKCVKRPAETRQMDSQQDVSEPAISRDQVGHPGSDRTYAFRPPVVPSIDAGSDERSAS